MQFAINQIFILPSFMNLENDEAIRNIDRVNGAIINEIKHLDVICHDWGAWDDSYEFMENGSQEFKDGSLSIESFVTANLNMIFYLKPTGEIYWGKIYNLTSEKEIQLKAFSIENFSKIYTNIKLDSNPSESPANEYKRGIILTENGPIMLAARPIVTSDNKGPSRGTLIMGRFLTKSILNKFKKETKANFNIHVCNSKLSLKLKKIVDQTTLSPKHVVMKTPNNVFMYNSFLSIQESPAFLIEVIFPREITKQGIKTIKYSLIFLIVVGFIILLLILMLIQKLILGPILNLSQHTKQIEECNYELRLALTRKDAIGELANCFDKMVAKIELQTNQLEKLSSLDGLTGLYNRRIFDETLLRVWKQMLREKQNLSAIMCDVDFFKLFNDNYGHQMGDKCLQSIADTIKASLKRPSDFVARYGGEEFVVLLSNTSPEGAQYMAEDIRKKVHDLKIKHDKSKIDKYVTLSLGVASVIPCQGASPIDLIETADQALYECKEKGRNMVVFKGSSG
jgi:diguanylate cyclase (GGDEF)-like protein